MNTRDIITFTVSIVTVTIVAAVGEMLTGEPVMDASTVVFLAAMVTTIGAVRDVRS